MLFVKGIAASSVEVCRPFSLPHFINEKEERACKSHPQRAAISLGGFEKKPGSHPSPTPTPPTFYVENSGFGLLANAMQSSSFVSLPNNVIGYNWGNYGLLEEAKHRC